MVILSHKLENEFLELSVDFKKYLKNYLIENKLSLSQFCKKHGIDEYGFRKALDPKIKMQLYLSTILSLSARLGIEKETIVGYTPLVKDKYDFEERKCLRV